MTMLKLDAWESSLLAGEHGPALQRAMQILVTIGEAYEAARMIPVTSAHLSGCSAVIAGEGGIQFLREMASDGTRVVVPTSVNISAIDRTGWEQMGLRPEHMHAQELMLQALQSMGAQMTCTCTPYLAGNLPKLGEHIAWGESAAIVYANSVLGARTNREGAPSSLAAALTGRVPLYGLHLDEARRGRVLVQVDAPIKTLSDYGTLGYYVGSRVESAVPVFDGLPTKISQAELIQLGAAQASSGPVGLFHVVSVTPEAATLEQAFAGHPPERILHVTATEMQETADRLNRATGDSVNWIYLGCPHASPDLLRDIAGLLEGTSVHDGVTLWVGMSRAVRGLAEVAPFLQTIEQAGGIIVSDTCPTTTFARAFTGARGYTALMTNSAKMAHYAESGTGLLPRFGTTAECIQAALTGKPPHSGGSRYPFEFTAHRVVGGRVQGQALVTRQSIGFLAGVDPLTGIITESGHEAKGACMMGKILVFPFGRGSSGGDDYQIYAMARRGTGPKGMINRAADPITAVGAILAQTPLVDRASQDPLECIRTGDWIELDADAGIIRNHGPRTAAM
jgi:predicted aconitase/predicted aconitase with swiveling domain